jgi:carboxypeptidase C (cathepsin A)
MRVSCRHTAAWVTPLQAKPTTSARAWAAGRLAAGLLCVALAVPGYAQTPEDRGRPRDAAPAAVSRPLPPDAVSQQTLTLPNEAPGPTEPASRTLHFTATTGFVPVLDDKGAPEAGIAATAYTLNGADPATRPVTFVLNGGPGMASAWLQMGAVGPWRIAMVPAPSAPAAPQPNGDTWLDFTDLVFLDPVGTGYSRFIATGDDVRKRLWSVNGDINALAQAIRRWLDRSGRIGSPKFLLGESYGGFRGPRLARRLAEHDGVGLRGLVLVSPVLDFGNHSGALDLLTEAALLPSMAAADRAAHGEAVSRAGLAGVEAYAAGPFLADSLAGVSDPAALGRVVDQVAALTGLDPAVVRQHRGLIGSRVFIHEHDRATGRVASLYDATVTGADPFPDYPDNRGPDPMVDGLTAPLTEAVLAVYQILGWHPEGPPYQLFDQDAARQWDYGQGFYKPNSVGPLREALALDPALQVIVAHGLFDLVCPYLASQWLLNQIPPAAGGDRVRLLTFPGGHMFYSRTESRQGLRAAAARLMTPP